MMIAEAGGGTQEGRKWEVLLEDLPGLLPRRGEGRGNAVYSNVGEIRYKKGRECASADILSTYVCTRTEDGGVVWWYGMDA